LFFSSRIHRTLPRRVGALVLSGALVAGLAGFALANPASAAHVEGVKYDGNPTCAQTNAAWEGFKIERADLTDTPHDDPDSDLVITIDNASDQTFDWVSNLDLVAVLVKASDGGLQYNYSGTTDTADTGLHGPSLTQGDLEVLYHDISHVSFCFAKPVVVPETPEQPETPQQPENPQQPVVVVPQAAPEVDATVAGKTIVLGETLVQGDTLPRTGAAETHRLALTGGLGLAFGLMMLMLARRKPAAQRN
jgi:hypothetical protein